MPPPFRAAVAKSRRILANSPRPPHAIQLQTTQPLAHQDLIHPHHLEAADPDYPNEYVEGG